MSQLPDPFRIEGKQPKHEPPSEFETIAWLLNPVKKMEEVLAWIGSTFYLLLRFMCVPAEMALLRRKFGERYVGLSLWIGGSFWLIAFMTGWIKVLPANGPAQFWAGVGITPPDFLLHQSVMAVISMLFGIRFFWEFVVKRVYKMFSGDLNINTSMHSRYDGHPLPLFYHFPFAKDGIGNQREMLVRLAYEPAFLFGFGVLIGMTIDAATGSFFMLSSIGMFAKELYNMNQIRTMMLDQLDAEIVSHNLSGALAGQSPEQTQGIRFAGLPTSGQKGEQYASLLRKAFRRKKSHDMQHEADVSVMPKSTFSATKTSLETESA